MKFLTMVILVLAVHFLKQIYNLLKPTGILFISDPKMHVSEKCFNKTITDAQNIGFQIIGKPKIIMSRTVILLKNKRDNLRNG